jgi:hypothetical protein
MMTNRLLLSGCLLALVACVAPRRSGENPGTGVARRSISDFSPQYSTVELAYFDPASNRFYLWEAGRLETLPLTVIDEPLLRFDDVQAGEHVAQGIWTVFMDIPGDELSRIHRAAVAHEEVYLVWNRRIVKTFRPQDCSETGMRYRETVAFRFHGFSGDETSAKVIARMIRDKHSGGDGAAQLGAAPDGATRRR